MTRIPFSRTHSRQNKSLRRTPPPATCTKLRQPIFIAHRRARFACFSFFCFAHFLWILSAFYLNALLFTRIITAPLSSACLSLLRHRPCSSALRPKLHGRIPLVYDEGEGGGMYDMLPIEGEGEEKGAGAGGSSLKILHAMVVGVSHDDAPVAVDGDTSTRVVELSFA